MRGPIIAAIALTSAFLAKTCNVRAADVAARLDGRRSGAVAEGSVGGPHERCETGDRTSP